MMTILFRTFLLYTILLFSVRLMGKRQIGQLEAGEFVAALLISELVAIPMTDTDVPISHGIVPLAIIASAEVITAFLSKKNLFIRRVLDGKPIVLVKDGSFLQENLEKARVAEDEVYAQMRMNGCEDIKMIKKITLEQNGSMSVITYEDSK